MAARNEALNSSGCGKHKTADPALSRGGLLVFFYRDPRERAIGMYNMLEAQDGSSPFMNKSDYDRVKMVDANKTNMTVPNGRVKRVSAPPSEEDIIWRFSKFIGWLKSRPFLTGRYVHFSPQAWYAGVTCSRGPARIDLVGRVERYAEVFQEIGRRVPQFRELHDAYLRDGGSFPPWYNRMHDARGAWSMVPCMLNEKIEAEIRDAFSTDYECFDERATRVENLLARPFR